MSIPFSKHLPQFKRADMNLKFVLIAGGLTLLLVTAVKCWYKCKDVRFCDRLRNRKPSNFMLKVSSKLNCSLIGKLVNKDTDKYFDFFLTALAGGKFSIYVNDPTHIRYQVNDSLTEMPLEADMNVNVNMLDVGELVVIEFEDIKIHLFTDPFNLTVYREDIEIAKVNPRQLLTFEEDPHTAVALDFEFPQALRAYGLPEHAERLALRTTTNGSEPYRLYNVDRYGYDVNSTQALYGSVPVLFGVGTKVTAGVFWLNSAQTFVDITNQRTGGVSSYFMSESGVLETIIFTGPTLKECVKQYTNLTGVAPLPQIFALGHHQSRYSYMSQKEVLEVCEKFDENKLPLDVIWMDIDYTDNKKYFTWDPKTFPQPNLLLDSLDKQGRKAVAIIDPHIKREKGYSVFDECESKGYFVKNPNDTSFQASCWPGLSSWIDFFNPDALSYYTTLIKDFTTKRNLHIWNDMNEPSVFDVEEQAMDGNCTHYEGWKHRDVHNQYGFYQTMGTYEGLLERSDNESRPFVLTRSFFAGSQRYAAHWTGDNVASWEHLKISIPMILTEALCGLSFIGADVGGFSGNPSEELLQRWYQAGTWYPFFRAHSAIETKRREPYLFDDKVKFRIRNSLQQRYKHLMYWYTQFWKHYLTGEPVIRPLSYEYPTEVESFEIDNEFLVGMDILVHPVTEKQAINATIYLPGGKHEIWYNIDDLKGTYEGLGLKNFSVTLDTVPVFYRGGSIIPIKTIVRSTTLHMKEDPVSLLIFLDKLSNARGNIYDDDQESFDYVEEKYTYIRFVFSRNTLRNDIINKNARYDRATIVNSIIIYGLQSRVNRVYIETSKTATEGDASNASRIVELMDVTTNKNEVRVDNLNLDIRNEFLIRFNDSVIESE